MQTLPAVAALVIGLAIVGADTHEVSAQGHASTGNEMLPLCRAFLEGPGLLEHATAEQALRAGFCAGCVRNTRRIDRAVRTVVEYLEAHSEQLDDEFEDLVERALLATWPCPPEQKP
jgi:hypothetical protein